MTRDNSTGIAQQVEIEHRIGGENGEPISVERA
jgi:hypothetical protein